VGRLLLIIHDVTSLPGNPPGTRPRGAGL
jgi:hypothetical protein